jgi:hypothetical protein
LRSRSSWWQQSRITSRWEGGPPRQNLRLHRKRRHPIRLSSHRHNTMIVPRRRRARFPPHIARRRSQRDHPRARPWQRCSRLSLALSFRLRAKPPMRLIRRRSSFSCNKANNSLRPAMWSRPESYFNELRRPAMRTPQWHWALRTIPLCLPSSVWRDWARTWRKQEPGTKRPRVLAQRKQHGGWPFLLIVSFAPAQWWRRSVRRSS